jgi:hypothetical protein
MITTIKHNLYLPTKDFKESNYVEQSIVIEYFNNTVQFKYTLPANLLSECIKIYPDKYKDNMKFVRSVILKGLEDTVYEMTMDIVNYHTNVDKVGDEVIFIKFNASNLPVRENTFGADMGVENKIFFQFYKGYKYEGKCNQLMGVCDVTKYSSHYKCSSFEPDRNKYKENDIVPLHLAGQHKSISNSYIIIPYTAERYAYLEEIRNNFIKLSDNLNEYLKDLTAEKLDVLLSTKQSLILS